MPLERCKRPFCGGWMKEIVGQDNKIEKICSKCAWPPDAEKIEKAVKEGKEKFIEFDRIFKAIKCQQESDRRKRIKLQRVQI